MNLFSDSWQRRMRHFRENLWHLRMAFAEPQYEERSSGCGERSRSGATRDCIGRHGRWHGRRSRYWEEAGPWSGYAGGPRGRFFEFGEVRLAILSLLKEGPKHGYQLIKELTDRSGGLYQASAGTVYPTLQQLEDEGLIAPETQDGRKTYKLTPEGIQELEREHETVERIWKRAERWDDWGQWMKHEMYTFFRPFGALVKSSFRAAKWAGGHKEREDKVIAILERAKHELDELSGSK
jgi:DNA-binding PadR family transcriptional regulator